MLIKLCLSITLLFFSFINAANFKDYEPSKKFKNRLNIAYYQGGDYRNYPLFLKAVVKSLSNFGWLEPIDLDNLSSAQEIWNKLSIDAKSDYINFKKDAFYSLDWNSSKRDIESKKLIKRKDIDMIFALGTWAGQDLSKPSLSTPTVVMSVSAPISSGILKDENTSSNPYIFATVDTKRYKRQVSLFHKIIKFKKLGITYVDSIAGRSYAALDDIKTVAKKRKFQIKECKISPKEKDIRAKIIKCYKRLAKSDVDAIYLTTNPAYKAKDLEYFIFDINKQKIPTFSQVGTVQVKYGALMSISRANFKYLGDFIAKAVGRILNGQSPSKQIFTFEEPVKLALNLKTAVIIDWDIPLSVIAISDEIYQTILTKDSLNFQE